MTTSEPKYLVLADFGRLGKVYVERDPVDMTWDATIADLARGEWDRPLEVIEFDIQAGTCFDVTGAAFDAARELRRAAGYNCVDSLRSCG